MTPPPPLRITNSTVLKPVSVRQPVIVPAPAEKAALAAGQGAPPVEPTVDPDLAAATLVQTGGTEPAAKDASFAKDAPAAKDASFAKDAPAAKDPPELPAPAALASGPAGAPSATRMVNSKRITLNYELKDVGASGIGGVEMWCTQDTRTWKKGEVVAQTNHSFTVEVKDEGLYGFTLLARNGSGAGKEAPQPGDQPQVWVSVDVTKPVVQITSLELTHGGKAPSVMIRWSAKDKNIGRGRSTCRSPRRRTAPGRPSPPAWRTTASTNGSRPAPCRTTFTSAWKRRTCTATSVRPRLPTRCGSTPPARPPRRRQPKRRPPGWSGRPASRCRRRRRWTPRDPAPPSWPSSRPATEIGTVPLWRAGRRQPAGAAAPAG